MATVTAFLYEWNNRNGLVPNGTTTFDDTDLAAKLTAMGYGTTASSVFGKSGNAELSVYPATSGIARLGVLKTVNTWDFIRFDNLVEQVAFIDLTKPILGDPLAERHGNVKMNRTAITADGAIIQREGMLDVTKASLCAMTIADPTTEQNGNILVITSRTAFAHTLTYTGGFFGAGTSYDAATWATTGGSITLQAVNGKWHILALYGVTIA